MRAKALHLEHIAAGTTLQFVILGSMSDKRKILVVDDQQIEAEVVAELARTLGYEALLANNGLEALDKLSLSFDMALVDASMPKMDGFELTRRLRELDEWGDKPIIMVTALGQREARLKALEAGVDDFIEKPVCSTELKMRTALVLELYDRRQEAKKRQQKLEELVERKTEALQKALDEMVKAKRVTEAAHLETVRCLALAAEFKDSNTAHHIERISLFSSIIGRALELSGQELDKLRIAATLHDVGKLMISDSLLRKEGELTEGEWQKLCSHTDKGAEILADSKSPYLEAAASIARSHHEKWDGSGYPKGLHGEEIPLFGRIVAIVDVFDVLTSSNDGEELTNEEAFAYLRKESGKAFDPKLVELFCAEADKVEQYQANWPSSPKTQEL